MRFLKDASVVIAYPLSEIFWQPLATSIFPDNLKVARISAIYKGKGSRSNPDNYRPISVLSVVSRLFEKLVHEQLIHIHILKTHYLKHNQDSNLATLLNRAF